MIEAVCVRAFQEVVWGDRGVFAGDGGAGHETALLPHAPAAVAHESGDAIFAMPEPLLAECVHDARAAISAAGGDESALDRQAQGGILGAASSERR